MNTVVTSRTAILEASRQLIQMCIRDRICITAAIDFIKNREAKKCGKCFLNTLKDAIAAIDE